MAKTTNCDRARLQSLNGIAYGIIVSPDQVSKNLFADVTLWLAVGGVLSGQFLTTAQVLAEYPGYTDLCNVIEGNFAPEFADEFA